MVALNRAWEILSDPSRRAAYDAARAAAARRDGARYGLSGAPPTAASPEFGRRAGPPDGGAPTDVRRGSSARQTAAEGDGLGTFTSGRSTLGGGYDPATMRAPDGTAAAGPPPGEPSRPGPNFRPHFGGAPRENAPPGPRG